MSGPTVLGAPSVVPPLPGDPAAVARCGVALSRAGARVGEVAGDADLLGLTPWQGAAGTAYRVVGEAGAEAARGLGAGLVRAGVEVLRHARGLTDLDRVREQLVGRREVLVGELAAATAVTAHAVEVAGRVRAFDTDVARWRAAVASLEAVLQTALETMLDGGPTAGLGPAPGTVGTDPAAVSRWWEGLGSSEQHALSAQPWIGALGGVPAWARDRANRLRLAGDLTAGGGLLTGAGGLLAPAWLRTARATARALEQAEGRLDPRTGEPVTIRLYLYDPSAFGGDGRVAVSYGDPGTADHVALQVPGMGTDAADVLGAGDRAWALYAASREDDDGSVAVLGWLGYDTPDNPLGDLDLLEVAGDDLARRGGALLGPVVAGLRAARDTPVHLTVAGHSYGSTTVAQGAAGPGVAADDIVMLGSPGPGRGVSEAADLGVGPGHVWVGTASSDPVGRIGGLGWVGGGPLGPDPAGEEFGAHRFRAEDADRHVGVDLSPDQHRGYWDPGSESLDNLVQITTGDYGEVTTAEPRRDPWWRPPVDPEASRPLAPTG